MKRRQTKQRSIVLTYISAVRTHPTAEEVFTAIKNKIPSLTLATVYRNLHVLADEGKIQRFRINNEYHFDGFTDLHHHLVCSKCGGIQDVESQKITRFISDQLASHHFQPSTVQVEGICGKCS